MGLDLNENQKSPIELSLMERFLLPSVIIKKHSKPLEAAWFGRENEFCFKVVSKISMATAILQPTIYFVVDSGRPDFDRSVSSLHRGVTFLLSLALWIAIRYRLFRNFRAEFFFYKTWFAIMGTVFCGFYHYQMQYRVDVPRYYAAVIFALMLASLNVGYKSTLIASAFHLLMLLVFSAAAEFHSGAFGTDFSLQAISTAFCLIVSSRQSLQAEIFVSNWNEKVKMTLDVGLHKEKGDHAFNQLIKLVYPHVVTEIQKGKILEQTMPVGSASAFCIALDIIESSTVKHADFHERIETVFARCYDEVMSQNYDQITLESNCYRVKEVGDGFLCTVGFPMKTPTNWSAGDLTCDCARRFVTIFNSEIAKMDYEKKICCAVGIAFGDVEAYFPRSGLRLYDVRGRGMILATRYENARKQLKEWFPIDGRSILTVSETVWLNLSRAERERFTKVDLSPLNMKIRDDEAASQLYFELLD